MLIDPSGNDATKRNRLKSFVDGPGTRHRRGWLDLALQCQASGVNEDWDCAHPHYDVLLDYRENLAGRIYKSALPFAAIKDCTRADDGADGTFSIDAAFVWPLGTTLDRFESVAAVHVDDFTDRLIKVEQSNSALEDVTNRQQTAIVKMPSTIEDDLRFKLRENHSALSVSSNVEDKRKALAFDMEVVAGVGQCFDMFDHRTDERGSRNLATFEIPDLAPNGALLGTVSVSPAGRISKRIFAHLFFSCKLTKKDIEIIGNRSMVPEELWLKAPTYKESIQAQLHGQYAAKDENLRIQQQTILKNAQPTVRILSSASKSLRHLVRVKIAASGRGVLSDDEERGLDVAEEESFRVLQASSDQLYLFAYQLTELDRQREENFVHCTTPTLPGKSAFKVDRLVSDPTVFVKDMSHMVTIAEDQRKFAKSVKDAGISFGDHQPYQPPAGGKVKGKGGGKTGKGGGKTGKGGRGGKSDAENKAQSSRDKARNAENAKATAKDKELEAYNGRANTRGQSSQE